MTNTETRNRNIEHLIEATVVHFCKLYSAAYEIKEGVIIVLQSDKSPWFYLYTEFGNDSFTITIRAFIFSNLSLSDAIRLREIYRNDNIIEFLDSTNTTLKFYKDIHLLTLYSFEWNYKNYALLKSKLILEIFTQLQNASEIREGLVDGLKKMENVGVG